MNKPSKTNIRTFVCFNNRTFECGKYTFVPALVERENFIFCLCYCYDVIAIVLHALIMSYFTCCVTGSITTRTHTGDKVVNQMSKFQTTAGVDETVKRSTPKVSSDAASAATAGLSSSPKYASSVVAMGQSVHTWGNPRSPPLPSPIQLEAMAQIKQPYVAPEAADNTSTSATDELPTLQTNDAICIAAAFAPTRTRTSPNGD